MLPGPQNPNYVSDRRRTVNVGILRVFRCMVVGRCGWQKGATCTGKSQCEWLAMLLVLSAFREQIAVRLPSPRYFVTFIRPSSQKPEE